MKRKKYNKSSSLIHFLSSANSTVMLQIHTLSLTKRSNRAKTLAVFRHFVSVIICSMYKHDSYQV